MNVTVIKEQESVIYNGVIYYHGDSFEVDEAIGESLMERGYVAITAAAPADEAPVEDTEEAVEELQEAVVEADELEGMSYSELKRIAAQKGLSAIGKKDELIARIREAEMPVEEAEESDCEELPNTAMPE